MNLHSLMNPLGHREAPPSPPPAATTGELATSVRSWTRHPTRSGNDLEAGDIEMVDVSGERQRIQLGGEGEGGWASPRPNLGRSSSKRARSPPPEPAPERVYHTSLLLGVLDQTLTAIRKEAGTDLQPHLDSDQLRIDHFRRTLNLPTRERPDHAEWTAYLDFCSGVNVPPFPITPVKAALCIARYVDLPASASLRKFGSKRLGRMDIDRVRAALTTLGGIARATDVIWKGRAGGFVAEPRRYVLFHEILEAAVPKSVPEPEPNVEPPPRGGPPFRSGIADLFRERPQLAKVTPAARVDASEKSSAPSRSIFQLPRRASSSVPASQAPSKRSLLARYYFDSAASIIPCPSLLFDLPHLLPELSYHSQDADRLGGEQASNLARFQREAHPRSARVRDIVALYRHLTTPLNIAPFPVTALKLALFALAYSPLPSHVALFAKSPALQHFESTRTYPRLLQEEMTHALDDLELVQVVSRGRGRVTEFEMEQWGEWRMGIMRDLWGDLPGSRAPQPPAETQASPVLASSSLKTHPPADRSSSTVPFRRTKTSPRMKAKRKETAIAVERGRDHRAPSLSPAPSSDSTTSKAGSTRGKTRQERRGWFYVRAPSPRPFFTPAVKGQLPGDRRPPPLPPVLPSPDVWVLAGTEEVEGKNRPLAKHRPRRVLPKMMELEWSESEGASDEED